MAVWPGHLLQAITLALMHNNTCYCAFSGSIRSSSRSHATAAGTEVMKRQQEQRQQQQQQNCSFMIMMTKESLLLQQSLQQC
jgi:hypothetical protein